MRIFSVFMSCSLQVLTEFSEEHTASIFNIDFHHEDRGGRFLRITA